MAPNQVRYSVSNQRDLNQFSEISLYCEGEKSLEDQEKEVEESVKKIMVQEKSALGSKSETVGKHFYLQLKAELEKKDEQMAALTAMVISLKVDVRQKI